MAGWEEFEMTLFYRGSDARITHEVIEIWCPTYRRFVLRDLTSVWVLEGPGRIPLALLAVRNGSSGMAGAVAVAAALAWAEGWSALESPGPALALVVLLGTSAAVAGACWRAQPVERELMACYRDRPVRLYRSADARTFGQVQRALVRALERLADER
jgi:hypothetical protein